MNDRRHACLCQVFTTFRAFGMGDSSNPSHRQARLEWASVVLNHNVATFKDLDSKDAARLADAANGAAYMARIWMERRKGERL